MRRLNVISRCQNLFRAKHSQALPCPCHHTFLFAVCRAPGRSQEEIARELCINKSTVARNLNSLEEKGYITREFLPNDKRQLAVYPTEKMLAVLPEIKRASLDWMSLLSEGISPEELEIFNSVLERMQARAREIIEKQEESK